MLFTEDSLMTNVNGLSILDESCYIDSDIATLKTVPVVENSALGAAVVRFSDIEALAESNGWDFIDAMEAVAEQNEIDPQYLAVAVDEARMIEEPELVYELANVVINPQSENSLAYQFCEACLDCYIDSEGDETFLEAMIDEANLADQTDSENGPDVGKVGEVEDNTKLNSKGMKRFRFVQDLKNAPTATQAYQKAHPKANKPKDPSIKDRLTVAFNRGIRYAKNNKGKIGAAAGAGLAAGLIGAAAYKNRDKIKAALGGAQAASAGKLDKIVAAASNKPKSWISQKIAALRGMYSKWLQKAQAESDAGKAGAIKKFAAKILACIDALMKKLENATA